MNSTRKHVLVVEDNPFIRPKVCKDMEREGYSVVAVDCAEAALAELEQSAAFDLVFSDVVLPGRMDGIDLVREIRHRWPHVKVLLTSGYPEDRTRNNLRMPDGVRLVPEAGRVGKHEGVELLAKPYSKTALKQALTQALIN